MVLMVDLSKREYMKKPIPPKRPTPPTCRDIYESYDMDPMNFGNSDKVFFISMFVVGGVGIIASAIKCLFFTA